VRMKIEDVEVGDPKEAMRKFKAALAQVVRVPKLTTRGKRANAQPKKKGR
jgi:hypothetical protein